MPSSFADTVNQSMVFNKSAPNPFSTVIFFIVLTIVYGFFMVYSIYSQSNNLEEISNSKSNNIVTLIYVVLVLMGTYLINISVHMSFCNNTENVKYMDVLIYTLLPWLLVFGVLYFLLELFDGWVRPFSNTIGYAVTNFLGLETLLKEKIFMEGQGQGQGENKLVQVFLNINSDISKFINEIDLELPDFKAFITKLSTAKIIKDFNEGTENQDIAELYKLVNIKFVVGKLMWYLLAGTLVASISYNYIINIECQSSLTETQTAVQNLYSESVAPVDGTKWQLSNIGPLTNDMRKSPYNLNNVMDESNLNMLTDTLKRTDSNGSATITTGETYRNGVNDLKLTSNNYVITDITDPNNVKAYIPIA